jgi:hypothetical protein
MINLLYSKVVENNKEFLILNMVWLGIIKNMECVDLDILV